MAAKQIADATASPPLPGLKAVFAGLTAAASGTEMVVKENAAESDVAAVMSLAAAMLVK